MAAKCVQNSYSIEAGDAHLVHYKHYTYASPLRILMDGVCNVPDGVISWKYHMTTGIIHDIAYKLGWYTAFGVPDSAK